MWGNLKELPLRRASPPITDPEVELVCHFMVGNKTVTEVHMAVNLIGTRGARAWAYVLKNNQTLRLLDLRDNEINNDGARALIASLDCNVSLTSLLLSGNVPVNRVRPQSLATIKYLTQVRNAKLIPDAARSAALYLVGICGSTDTEGMGALAVFPKEIVLMIAVEVWASRLDPKWIDAVNQAVDLD